MVPDLAAALQPRGEATKGWRPGGATRRRRLGRTTGEAPSSRACPAGRARAARARGRARVRGRRRSASVVRVPWKPQGAPDVPACRPYGTVGGGGHRRKFVSRFGPTSPSLTPIAAIQWSATMPSSMIVRALGLATLALFFLGAFTPLPVFLYEMISVPVHIERADAIVVLAGGGVLASGQLTDTSLRRTTRGIALYRDGLAPLLVLSGAAGRRSGGAARAVLAREGGAPGTGILGRPAGPTTHEGGAVLRPLLRARGVRRLVLLTEGAP